MKKRNKNKLKKIIKAIILYTIFEAGFIQLLIYIVNNCITTIK